MNKSLLLCLTLTATFQANAIIDTNLQMQLGNPSGATADTNNHNNSLSIRSIEAIDYNDNRGQANWASWDLTSGDANNAVVRQDSFAPDTTNLPANFYIVDDGEYSGSGYDRGHLCPSADRTDSTNHNDLTFFMSNMMPQAPDNNRVVWADFEDDCRTFADAGNEVLIICGPSGFNGSSISSSTHVLIPSNTWKVVVIVPLGGGTALSRITTITNRVIAIRVPNTNGVSANWSNYVTSAHQIELETGFNFFTALPGTIASAFRAKIDNLVSPPPPSITSFTPTSGQVNTNVVITGTNFNGTSVVKFNGSNAVFIVDSNTQITAVVPTNATTGTISVTTPGGTATSAGTFTITSSTPPGITTQPQSQTVNVGSNVLFTVTATGTPTLNYQWRFTGTNIGGATLSSYTRSNAQTNDAGSYSVVITNSISSITSAVAVLTVNEPSGGGSYTGTLIGWDMNGQSGGSGNFGTSPLSPTTNAPDITVVGLTRGIGVGTTGTGAARGWGGNSWTNTTSANAIGSNQFVTFSATADTGFKVSFGSISKWDYRRSGTGATNGVLQYQVGAGAFTDITNVFYTNVTTSGSSLAAIDLSGITALQNVGAGTSVTFRIVNWGGTSSAGTWYVFDVANNTNYDFALDGTVSSAAAVNTGPVYEILSFTLNNPMTPSQSGTFIWETVSNRTYNIERSGIVTGGWTTFHGGLLATGTSYTFTTNVPFGTNFFRVYRAP